MRTLCSRKQDWGARGNHLVRQPKRIQPRARAGVKARVDTGGEEHGCGRRHRGQSCHERLAVQCQAMKSRFRVGVVLVTLAVHLLAPLGAYASATLPPGFDDFCSANRSATALPGSTPTLPLPYSPKHVSSHCAYCSGSASAAVLPSALPLPVLLALAEASLLHATCPLVTATAVLLPPSRGPPRVS
jgi:hypothetical protein